ncbi:hypothetical protein [Cutibacterium sp.]|uniref:hypothetical protein n=1 Tax=Cutibacterium sp. TaxID=1912221 RepID=UPI0026DB16B4|nr:hypothetical protein [Cutibacterium sp.]MDO4412103.1 hypothetical protein [Cutibacterium sp.]
MFVDRYTEHSARGLAIKILTIAKGLQCGGCAYPTEADLKSLQKFFPEANLTKLVKIEKFHTKIQTILSKELQEALTQVTQALEEYKGQKARLISQMDAIPPSKAFTQEFLDAYTSLDRRINKLQDENDAFDKRAKLQKEKQEANHRYQEQLNTVLAQIEIVINSQMEAINDEFTGGYKGAQA